MLGNIQKLSGQDFRKLLDLRHVSTAMFSVLVLLISWSGIKVIGTNYELQKQISSLQQQTDVERLENDNLKLKNQYLNSDQYLELSAREHFNKAAPGEKLLIVPSSVAMAHSIAALPPPPAPKPAASRPWYERNFNAWLDFFFHRADG